MIGVAKNNYVVGDYNNLINFPQADDIMSQFFQKVQPPCDDHVVREDGVLLMEGPEAYGVIYLPRASSYTHIFRICWCYQEVCIPNPYYGCNIAEVLGDGPGENHKDIVLYEGKLRIEYMIIRRFLMIPCEAFLRAHLSNNRSIDMLGSGRGRVGGIGYSH